jgi:hypothetical protein
MFFIIENSTTATLVSLVSIQLQNQSDTEPIMSLDRFICGMLNDYVPIKINILFIDHIDEDVFLSKIVDNTLQNGQ